jgi:LmbE family N-acetylglucosaminyl deacetylase
MAVIVEREILQSMQCVKISDVKWYLILDQEAKFNLALGYRIILLEGCFVHVVLARSIVSVMQQLRLDKDTRALCIVAHPDDETIWMGGALALHKDIKWTIFVLCRESDLDRMPKFRRVAQQYNAKGIICDLEDEGIMSIAESVPQIKNSIRKKLPQKTWDALFVHGSNGEYGHPRHKGVHLAVKQMVKNRELKAKKRFCFAYRLDEKKGIAVPRTNAQYSFALSTKDWKEKRNVVKQLYGFRTHSFENRSCAKTETFVDL